MNDEKGWLAKNKKQWWKLMDFLLKYAYAEHSFLIFEKWLFTFFTPLNKENMHKIYQIN